MATEESTCPRCQTQYIVITLPSGAKRPERCPSCYPAPRDETPKADATPFSGDILEALDGAGVNVNKYQDATLESFDPTHDPQALEAAHHYIEHWRLTKGVRFPRRDWFYFYGEGSSLTQVGRDRVTLGKLGNGKTHLAIAVGRKLIEMGLLHPAKFAFRSAEEILLECEATFRSQSTDSEIKLLHRYERLDYLIIDEMGVRAEPSPHAIRVFDELTKKREAKGTGWTGNLSIKVVSALSEGMKRIASRLGGEVGDGACYYVEFSGPNRRSLRSRRTA